MFLVIQCRRHHKGTTLTDNLEDQPVLYGSMMSDVPTTTTTTTTLLVPGRSSSNDVTITVSSSCAIHWAGV